MAKTERVILIIPIILAIISLASGLSLTASTGGTHGSSFTSAVYGATIKDFTREHIQLRPGDGTLSTSLAGSGSLPLKSISIADSQGNYAQVYRSVSGTKGITTWTYEWNTEQAFSDSGSGVKAWLTLTADKASSITGGSASSNSEGDRAQASISVSSSKLTSSLKNYHAEATAFTYEADASQSADSAVGNLIDMKSHAQNTRLAQEYLSYSNGQVLFINTRHGGADFEVKIPGSITSPATVAKATASDVTITPTLPDSIKTAVMLEPFQNAFVSYARATDLGSTVYPDLVKKGYATLRYTDSAASSDKFQDLGNYNVVLVDAHMDSDNIGLSTGSGYIASSNLNYQTSKNSLVILSGCESFAGSSTTPPSGLAGAVSSATVRGGFKSTVGTLWASDYVSYFFDSLSQGKTASVANSYALATANKRYRPSPYNVPLTLSGDQSFTL